MLDVLSNRTYRHLFLAQIIALVGTGLATVALGLLAYEIAGADAGAVLGTAMAIKMIAYIGIAPVVGAYANRLPRKTFLVAMDVARGLVALILPFVDQVWQIYILIFILQSASAGFTPSFQATIPDVLPDEKAYTKALSLSRLAYDMESLASPLLAAALLGIMNFHWLFSGTAIGFAASALLVLSVTFPQAQAKPASGGIYDRTTRGTRQYLKTPRLRGLLAVTLAAAAASAMVIVNTPVLVRGALGLGQSEVAITFAAFGGGSMIAALLLPRLLDRTTDRSVMIAAAACMSVVLALLAASWSLANAPGHWPIVLAGWFALGLCYAASITPGGRLLRRSSGAEDRPALFAAQFALSHVCWLIAYPLAGQIGARAGMGAAFGASAAMAFVGTLVAWWIWPRKDPEIIEHRHDDLSADHPHLRKEHAGGTAGHPYIIDELHRSWPDH
ncbi:MFS transporter [uncultured Sphingosinicella sp.]|uniref:MFS transporter n=1 Tax=uncultured Sphingosinicella sp. TaxID=478748 RepID=UPI0030DB1077|tara:strand:- start:617 stop:1951 length:1335 start_codon:yes stop_codon:yes gene_type:complete